MEVETSVMSKVSCTACKVATGLLQHYIKVGKDDKEIMNSIYQFCVSLNIQSSRVCQGVTLLFGVSFISVLLFLLVILILKQSWQRKHGKYIIPLISKILTVMVHSWYLWNITCMFRKSILKLFDIVNEYSNPLRSSNQIMRVSKLYFIACSYFEIISDLRYLIF